MHKKTGEVPPVGIFPSVHGGTERYAVVQQCSVARFTRKVMVTVKTPSNRADLILSPCCSVMTFATDSLIAGEQEVFEVVQISAAVQNRCFLRFSQALLAR